VSAKTKQINTFGSNNVIKTTNDKTFTINNDVFVQWYAKKLNKKIRIGHKYKITTYRLLFAGRNILSAKEIKTTKRRVIKK
jgi:aminoglycoside/choline kinase family phosphotransferase